MTGPSYRRRLADMAGILPGYTDVRDNYHETSEETRARLLAAMGFAADTEEAAREELERVEAREVHQIIDPVAVVSTADVDASPVRLRSDGHGQFEFRTVITDESGATDTVEGAGMAVDLPRLAPGYYRLLVEGRGEASGEEIRVEQHRIVHPPTCYRVERATGGERRFGLWTNLYAIRSDRNWGVGDLGDLRRLMEWAGEERATFVGLNPLHALRNTPPDVSPYYPLSRVFVNPLYLDLEQLPEWSECDEAQAKFGSVAVQGTLERLRTGAAIDYASVWELKLTYLHLLYATFERLHRNTDSERGRRFAAFCERYGDRMAAWSAWMADRHPGTSGGFHTYLQFAMDEQLTTVTQASHRAGLELGLYHDLAVGTAGDGADVALYPEVFVPEATIGAPPDAYAEDGQDWSVRPLHPLRLRDSGYRYWRDMLDATMRHAGALRIDHVMGLERQFWVPAGCPAREGAYVRYPAAGLLGVLALESERHHTVVVGESLGTVPEGFVDRLHEWGVLSSQVLYFERDPDTGYRGSREYSAKAMVTVNTHDLATWRGFWTGQDLVMRREAGVYSAELYERLRAEREVERTQLVDQLTEEGFEVPPASEATAEDLCPAVHGFLGATPAPLIGVALDDLGGEVTGVNIPGAPLDRHVSWTRRHEQTLSEIRDGALARSTLDAVRRSGRGRPDPKD